MPMYPTPAELESQKRRLRHKAAPIVSHEPIIIEESWVKSNMVPIIGAVVGLTSLALVGTTLVMLNKKKHFIGGHVEEEEVSTTTTSESEGEGFGFGQKIKHAAMYPMGMFHPHEGAPQGEGWGTKLKSGAKKAALGFGASKMIGKFGHHEEEESTTTTSESEEEGFGQKVVGGAKKAALLAGAHQMMKPKTQKKGLKYRLSGKIPFMHHEEDIESTSTTTTSEEEEEGYGQKVWRGAKKAGMIAGAHQMTKPSSGKRGWSSKVSNIYNAPFVGKVKSRLPFMHHEQDVESTSTTTSEDEGMNLSGKAKKAAGLAAAGYGIKKIINRNASESSTSTSASTSEDEGFGQKAKAAALGMGLSRSMKKPKTKIIKKKKIIKRKQVPVHY